MTLSEAYKTRLISALTFLVGLLTLGSTLAALAHSRHHVRLVLIDAHLTVIAGISLIYLATLLNRGKRNAWLISLPIYSLLIVRNYQHFVINFRQDDRLLPAILNLAVPVVGLILLICFRSAFVVRSEFLSFTRALNRALLVLLIAFLYGVVGFYLMDDKDFHQELNLASSSHYTIDQLGLTTNQQITPYTKRAHIFLGSLATVSLVAMAYAAVSLFAPIRFRLLHSQDDIELIKHLSQSHSRTSEDFFKSWPRDKNYYFNRDRTAGLAYKVSGGVALVVGDPIGPKARLAKIVKDFSQFCRVNDWEPAFINVDDKLLGIYRHHGFDVQKIGEEAIIDTRQFSDSVATNKYFRQINNRFTKHGYQCQLLTPPHSKAILKQLKHISDDWLKGPGRAERGFMMGYFRDEYIQQCQVMAVTNSSGQIEAFANQLPSTLNNEANFDFLRHLHSSLGNINDFLMMNFVKHLSQHNVAYLNMGLAPLSGLEKTDSDQNIAINRFLNFAYAAGSRFYSFQGLKRFKNKYEPNWQDRYVVYRGGVGSFAVTMNALIRAMKP